MNVLDVLFHRRQGDDQPVRDLAIGQPLCDEAQHRYLARAQWFRQARIRRLW